MDSVSKGEKYEFEENTFNWVICDEEYRLISIDAQNVMRNANGLTCLFVTLRKLLELDLKSHSLKGCEREGGSRRKFSGMDPSDSDDIPSNDSHQLPRAKQAFLIGSHEEISQRHRTGKSDINGMEVCSDGQHFKYKLKKKNQAIELIYLVLSRCCINNSKNKEFISNYNDQILKEMMFDPSNTTCLIIFLNEFLTDNQEILLNSVFSASVYEVIFDTIGIYNKSPFKQAYYVSTLVKFIFHKNHCIKSNQNNIISMLVSGKVKQQFTGVYPPGSRLIGSIRDHHEETGTRLESKTKIIHIPSPLTTVDLAYLELVTACAYGKNSFTEKICHTLFSLDECLELIEDETIGPLLHLETIKFFYHVFVDTELMYNSLYVEIMKVMPVLQNSLKFYLEKLSEFAREALGKKAVSWCNHKEVISEEELLKEIIEVLIDSIKTYIQSVIMSSNRKSIAKVLQDEVVVKVYRIIIDGIKDIRGDNFKNHLEKLLDFIDHQVRLGNLSKGHGDTAEIMNDRRSNGESKVIAEGQVSYEQ
jgi:hypothetical protein